MKTPEMSIHAYTNCWIHLIWSTYKRQQYFDSSTAVQVARFLRLYAQEQGLHLPVNYVNSDHVHCLIALPASVPLENVVKLLKGASSHWINRTRLVPMKFSWGRGYGAFSISRGHIDRVSRYIAGQKAHHGRITFEEECRRFLRDRQVYGDN